MNATERAIVALRKAERVVVLSGAGASKESGVPTFRDALEGLWAKYDPQELATPSAFARNPKLVWDWYRSRREKARSVQPNPGHYALAELERYIPNVLVVTQNVDDLHEQAGSSDVRHLHGSLFRDKCSKACQGEPTIVDADAIDFDPEDGPPPCPHCGANVRPDVVWFGEALPPGIFQAADEMCRRCDVMLVAGTSGIVTPAAYLPITAQKAGATIIEVNPSTTPITDIAHIHLKGPAGEMLPPVVAALADPV